jgi:hypothetical protein
VREGLLAAIDVDAGDAIALVQQVDGKVKSGGGFTRTAFLIAHNNDVNALPCHPQTPEPQIHFCYLPKPLARRSR